MRFFMGILELLGCDQMGVYGPLYIKCQDIRDPNSRFFRIRLLCVGIFRYVLLCEAFPFQEGLNPPVESLCLFFGKDKVVQSFSVQFPLIQWLLIFSIDPCIFLKGRLMRINIKYSQGKLFMFYCSPEGIHSI